MRFSHDTRVGMAEGHPPSQSGRARTTSLGTLVPGRSVVLTGYGNGNTGPRPDLGGRLRGSLSRRCSLAWCGHWACHFGFSRRVLRVLCGSFAHEGERVDV